MYARENQFLKYKRKVRSYKQNIGIGERFAETEIAGEKEKAEIKP